MQATGMLRENHSGYPERCSIYVWTGFLEPLAHVWLLIFLASDQYLAIVVPGNMLKDAYSDRDLAPEKSEPNFGGFRNRHQRVDSMEYMWCGTEWNIGRRNLGTYLPYCIFNWVRST